MDGPAEEAVKRIDTLRELQDLGPALLKRINADQGLAVAAVANPILALSELGYELAPAVRQDLEERSRFSKRQIVQRRKLRNEVRRAAGRDVDVGDPADLRRLLTDELKIKGRLPDDLSLPAKPTVGDALDQLRTVHPALKPILMLRALEAGAPRFAPLERYRAIRSGAVKLPSLHIAARLTSKPKPQGEKSSRRRGSRNA
jgi:hypothetical protein